MSYETAPATELLATHCACCARPLVDATSVETGVGPDCRRKHGFDDAQSPPDWATIAKLELDGAWPTEARQWANKLIHHIAADRCNPDAPKYIAAVYALGFQRIATTIAQRFGAVVVSADGDRLLVQAPYSDEWNEAARSNRWRWDREAKARVVPVADRVRLWGVLARVFPGMLCLGTKAVTIIAKAA